MRKLILLFLVCACQAEQSPKEPDPINAIEENKPAPPGLSTIIAITDTRKPDAISQAVLQYRINTSMNSPLHCDNDLVILKAFAIRAAHDINQTGFLDTMIREDGRISPGDERKLNRLGYMVNYVEGEPYLSASPGYLLESLRPCLSAGMILFLEEFEKEARQTATQGEQLQISVDELLRRVLFWEDFMNEYPNFVLKEEAKTTYHFFLSLYMTGTGTSRAFDARTLHFNPEFRMSYERFMKSNANSPTAQFIGDYYRVLKQNNFYYSSEVENYYSGVQSPYWGK